MAFVDDFFSVSPSKVAERNFDLFKWFFKLLGFPLKEKKETPPTQEDDLLGVRVHLEGRNSNSFSLPQAKRLKYRKRIRAVLQAALIKPFKQEAVVMDLTPVRQQGVLAGSSGLVAVG